MGDPACLRFLEKNNVGNVLLAVVITNKSARDKAANRAGTVQKQENSKMQAANKICQSERRAAER